MRRNFRLKYSPNYFLAALGHGGLAVTFFMYLMFMIPHEAKPMPTYENVKAAFIAGGVISDIFIGIALLGMIYYSINHYALVIRNVKEYMEFRYTKGHRVLFESNRATSIMVIPLTLAMSVNVAFVNGAIFVPGIWNYIELLLPVALSLFLLLGAYSLKIFFDTFVKKIIFGQIDIQNTTSFSYMIISFTFSMVAVGLAAPGAMSHVVATSAIGLISSIFFFVLSVLSFLVILIYSLSSVLKNGIDFNQSPSLWIAIPIGTLLGISVVRISSGISHNFAHTSPSLLVIGVLLTIIVSIQGIFGLVGYYTMKKNEYFEKFLEIDYQDTASFGLICPGVASFVIGMFFIHWVLVKNNVISQFDVMYFILIGSLLVIQLKTMIALNKTMFELLPFVAIKRKSNYA